MRKPKGFAGYLLAGITAGSFFLLGCAKEEPQQQYLEGRIERIYPLQEDGFNSVYRADIKTPYGRELLLEVKDPKPSDCIGRMKKTEVNGTIGFLYDKPQRPTNILSVRCEDVTIIERAKDHR